MTARQRPPGAVWWTVSRRPGRAAPGTLSWVVRRTDWPPLQVRQFASQSAAYTWAYNMAIAAAQGHAVRDELARMGTEVAATDHAMAGTFRAPIPTVDHERIVQETKARIRAQDRAQIPTVEELASPTGRCGWDWGLCAGCPACRGRATGAVLLRDVNLPARMDPVTFPVPDVAYQDLVTMREALDRNTAMFGPEPPRAPELELEPEDVCTHPNGFGAYGCPCGATRDGEVVREPEPDQCSHRCTCGHDKQEHTTSGYCNACSDQCPHDDGHYPDDCLADG